MLRLLFVDDEPGVLEGIRSMLEPRLREWDLRFASSAGAALEALEQRPADVVITDMGMPDMDGAALLRLIREKHPRTLRIVLSGHSDHGAAFHAAALAHHSIAKPCDTATLTAAIEGVVARGERDLPQDPPA